VKPAFGGYTVEAWDFLDHGAVKLSNSAKSPGAGEALEPPTITSPLGRQPANKKRERRSTNLLITWL